MKSKKFSLATKISIISFWVILLGLFVYYVMSPKWMTYVDAGQRFHFKYPENFNAVTVDERQPPYEGVQIVDPKWGVRYLFIFSYKGNIKDDIDLEGPYPRIIPPNGKNGKILVDKRIINGISGVEVSGYTDEGHSYMDTFYFQKGEYVYRIELNVVGEGKFEQTRMEVLDPSDLHLDMEVYRKIRDSFNVL